MVWVLPWLTGYNFVSKSVFEGVTQVLSVCCFLYTHQKPEKEHGFCRVSRGHRVRHGRTLTRNRFFHQELNLLKRQKTTIVDQSIVLLVTLSLNQWPKFGQECQDCMNLPEFNAVSFGCFYMFVSNVPNAPRTDDPNGHPNKSAQMGPGIQPNWPPASRNNLSRSTRVDA